MVNPRPDAQIALADTFCVTTIAPNGTPSTIANPGVISTYDWDMNNDGTVDIANGGINPSYTYLNTGNYTIRLITTSADGCKDTVQKPVSVNRYPDAAFSVTPTVNCNQPVTFNASASTGQIVSYRWDYTSNNSIDQVTGTPTITHTFPGPGTYTSELILKGSGSCYDTTFQTFTIHPVPLASFTLPASICGSTASMNATASTVAAPSSIGTYSWDFNNDGTAELPNGGATPTYTFPAAGNYQVNLIVTTPEGCKDTIQHPISVYTIPTAAMSISPSLNCNQPVTFNASASLGPVNSYNWDFNSDGTSDQTTPGSSVTHTYPSPGTYTATLIVNATGNCLDTITQTVVIHPVPTASFSFPNGLCLLSVPFDASGSAVANPSTIASYGWDFNNDGIIDQTTSTPTLDHIFTQNGTATVNLTVTTNAGCTASLNQQVTVFNKPDANFLIAPAPNCNQPVNLDASVSFVPGTNTIDSYIWDYTGDGTPDFSSPSPGTSHTYAGPGTYTVSLITLANGNCADTISRTFTINPVPVAAAQNVQPVCGLEAPLNASASTVSSGNITQFNWDVNGDGSIEASGANVPFTFPGPGSYNIVLTTISDSGCTDQTSITIVILPVPTADFDLTNICITDSAQFTNQTTWNGGNPTLSYSWNFGDNSPNGNSTDIAHGYTQPGTYNVQLIAQTNSGCSDTITQEIIVSQVPVAAFSFVPQCFQVVTFADLSSTNGGSPINYNWDFGDGIQSDTASLNHTFQNPGTYNVALTVTNEQGCSSDTTQSITVIPSASLDKLIIPNILTVNGDGINDIMELDPNFETCLTYDIDYFNRWGNKVYAQKKGDLPFPGNRRLEPGVYFYVIQTGNIIKNGTVTIVKP
jgi:PKD repeat protein